MDYSTLVDSLTPELIERFSDAVATGKWSNGEPLTDEQREHCMQAVMLYNARHNSSDEPFTINQSGELITGKKIRSEYKGQSSNDTLKINSDLLIDSKTKH